MIGRTLRTLSYLTPRQALHYLRQRGIGPAKVRPVDDARKRHLLRPKAWLFPKSSGDSPWEFRFLNQTLSFPDGQIDWQPQLATRLWRYNLHYFNYLGEADRPDSVKQAMLDQWIDENPQMTQPAWEPYTTSLRIANWIKFFLEHPSSATEPRLASLHTQARWLRKNLERHILANHYFENIKALLFAGAFLHGLEADGWRKFATRELGRQLREQTLADGCHYERAPAYHCLMLQNYLELYALVSANGSLFSPELGNQLRDTADKGLGYLADILLPGDLIPLFNDSAFDSGPSPASLFSYADLLDISWRIPSATRLVSYQDAGVYGYMAGGDGLLVDCGEIGPVYQPGHTHCDFLSYELALDGSLLVVDTGVSEYEPGEFRDYVRSTRAHNTVSVGDDEQSEIWGEFRVARRARKLSAGISISEGGVEFSGAYRGFYGLGGKVEHRRKLKLQLEGESIASIEVIDDIPNAGGHRCESYIHLHPDVVLEEQREGTLLLRYGSNKYAIIVPRQYHIGLAESFYCPEFGLRQPNLCVALVAEGSDQVRLSYQIKKIS